MTRSSCTKPSPAKRTVVSAPVSTTWPTAVYARDQAGVVSITATGAAAGAIALYERHGFVTHHTNRYLVAS